MPQAVRVVTVTVSDTRTAEDDLSGRALREELAAFELLEHTIVPDEPERIAEIVRRAASGEADAVVLTGGTGIAPRDRTYEAIEALFHKRIDGFGEAFRRLSWDEIGPRAILSRATAGTVGSCLVFALPGSEKAARLGARALVLPVLAHAVDLAHGRTSHARHGKKEGA
jgi:molybdenum cofactor biosynthesis protein B